MKSNLKVAKRKKKTLTWMDCMFITVSLFKEKGQNQYWKKKNVYVHDISWEFVFGDFNATKKKYFITFFLFPKIDNCLKMIKNYGGAYTTTTQKYFSNTKLQSLGIIN